jgi:hypothetical protein
VQEDLARKSVQLPAAARISLQSAVSAPFALLEVLSSTNTRRSGRKLHISGQLSAFATKPVEKCGLEFSNASELTYTFANTIFFETFP